VSGGTVPPDHFRLLSKTILIFLIIFLRLIHQCYQHVFLGGVVLIFLFGLYWQINNVIGVSVSHRHPGVTANVIRFVIIKAITIEKCFKLCINAGVNNETEVTPATIAPTNRAISVNHQPINTCCKLTATNRLQ
jgi:hypothetical protein